EVTLGELEKLQLLAERMKALRGSDVQSRTFQQLQSELNDGLRDRELDSVEELLTLIADIKRQIAQLKVKGREKTAKEKEVTLGELEKLQSLAERMKALRGSDVQSRTFQQLQSELNDGLRDRELDSVEELLTLIADIKRQIAQLKVKGREKTAKEKEVTLGELEKLQSLAERMKALRGSDVQSRTFQQLQSELNDGLRDRELDSLEELLTVIADTKRDITQLKTKGKEKTAKEKEVTLGELEKLQSLAEQVKALKPVNIVEPGNITR
ncbi:unnamed protein product, partial [Rotaria magnacalcarata]